jgi:hypothetical protein
VATVVSALADADMFAAGGAQRPSELIFQQAQTEYRARLSATGRQQLEQAITARIKEQVELSIAELTDQLRQPELEEPAARERAGTSDAAPDPAPPPSIGGMVGQADVSKLLSSDDESDPEEPAAQERAS